jgi:acetyltransferase-like isoleucine patch superfamily enzyme
VSLLQSFVETLVGSLKSNPEYRIASDYENAQLATILWHRGRQFVRGVPLRLRASGVQGLVLRGRNVVVEHARQLSTCPGLILDDAVFITALSRDGIILGHNVRIARAATLLCTGVIAEMGVGIRIGDRSAVGAGSFLGGQGGIAIGDDVIMGPGVRIYSENHRFDMADRPIRAQGVIREAVSIGNDCWIGGGVTILAGVSIGAGSVIAAGSVVPRDIPPLSVAAGVPARVIRARQRAEVHVPGLFPPLALVPPRTRAENARQGDR